ncbi:sugar ABC transporter substrate-binding protein [Amycolatopsis panacis]|uniref:sugar ABC transporter substrate-binding protein n=1 Tax=Amycolatopsis panacis TaxID=2340917 RepID=UPI0013147E69|nr:sugar ABC transporter substrate-binding protein [Amycolatopsis panacis]
MQFSSADPNATRTANAYKAEAETRKYKVSVVDANGSADSAVAAMQNFVQKRVDLIITETFPSEGLAAGTIAAKEAGIPVVSLAGGLADGVQTNWDIGYPQGVDLATRIVKDTGGKGALLELTYRSGYTCAGNLKALTEKVQGTGLAVTANEIRIPGQVEDGTTFTQAWLAKHPDAGDGLAVWGCFDDPALGAIAAIKQAGRANVKVYGLAGSPPALKAIKDGSMTATVWFDLPAAGREAARKTADYIQAGVDAKPSDVAVPFQIVDQSNIDAFLAEHPEAVSTS